MVKIPGVENFFTLKPIGLEFCVFSGSIYVCTRDPSISDETRASIEGRVIFLPPGNKKYADILFFSDKCLRKIVFYNALYTVSCLGFCSVLPRAINCIASSFVSSLL